MRVHQKTGRSCLTVAVSWVLIGCGGSDDSTPTPPPTLTPTSITIGGTAVKGAALASAAVTVKCGAGTGTTTTAANGAYTVAIKEQVEAALRLEPGVLALYAVADKENPAHVTVFEIYADAAAYKAHLETAHFKSYKITTEDIVKSLKLRETVPILLGVKRK